MIKTKPLSKTQWNRYVRPFSSRSEREIDELLKFCSDTALLAERLSGCDCFLAYGGLLGYQRTGKLISHDFDIDVAINFGESDKENVAQSCQALIGKFLDLGYKVKGSSLGQFFILPPDGRQGKVEFFASWVEKEKYYLYFAVPGAPIASSVTKLKEIHLHGHKFKVPLDPSKLLEATYGADWMVPNPDFSYDMNPTKWKPFRTFFSSRNKRYWENYYMSEATVIGAINDAALTAILDVSQNKDILDVGCGTSGIVAALAPLSHRIVGVDFSTNCIRKMSELNAGNNVDFEELNLYDTPQCREFISSHSFDVVCCIDTLDVVSTVGENSFWRLVSGVANNCTEVILSFPMDSLVSCPSEEREYCPHSMSSATAYRRTISLDNMCIRAKKAGFIFSDQKIVASESLVVRFINAEADNIQSGVGTLSKDAPIANYL